MLLYLNNQTFVGGPGEELAAQARAARESGLPMLLVHEVDPGRGGIDFDYILHQTPDDLCLGDGKTRGLYADVAVMLQPSSRDRIVSLTLALQTLAKVKKNELQKAGSFIRRRVNQGAGTGSVPAPKKSLQHSIRRAAASAKKSFFEAV